VKKSFFRATVLALAISIASPTLAQEKTGTRPGFVLEPGAARIVLVRPAIRVGAQSTGGLYEPNADWTHQARQYIEEALREVQGQLGNEIVIADEDDPIEGATVRQYVNLFGSVADSVIEYQFFRGNRLPTKVRSRDFDWTVGPGLRDLISLRSARYALFINTRDEYGSTGRKILQVAGLLAGVPVVSGVHHGYAGLVDLETGDLVWLNADRQMGGDVRTQEGARKRVRQLLEGFPGRPSAQEVR
jgi:hypothetical protein